MHLCKEIIAAHPSVCVSRGEMFKVVKGNLAGKRVEKTEM